MALLTIPSSPEKGTAQEYILNVTDLIALVSEAYFQDQANWSKVVLVYQSSVSNQLEVINFIPDGVSTEISELAEFSEFARDLFEVNSITIFDKQNGRYIIKASQIPDVANYAIDFAIVPPAPGVLTWDFASNPNYYLTVDNQIASNATSLDPYLSSLLYSSNTYVVGNGIEFSVVVDNGFFPESTPQQCIGAGIVSSGVFGSFYRDYAVNQLGVQNNINTLYPYPATPEIEFKMVIKETETLFYTNGVLLATLGPLVAGMTSSSLVSLILRFNNEFNVKSATINIL